ncbi:MAG: hypothetical protein COA53_07710 [Rhodobacteraceae bacterium]|nr:MAG: hypothetical protein COA53_07710 [Paracoccaceae bacterium]
MKPRFFRLSFLYWILVPIALYGVFVAFGLPHSIWSYEFVDNGSPYDPFLERYYTSCTYWGPYGAFTIPANQGSCQLVAFFKEAGR